MTRTYGLTPKAFAKVAASARRFEASLRAARAGRVNTLCTLDTTAPTVRSAWTPLHRVRLYLHYNLPPLWSWEAEPLRQLIGQQRVVVHGDKWIDGVFTSEWYAGFRHTGVYTEPIYSGSAHPTPNATHPAGLDARRYLEPLPASLPRAWPLDLHDFLAQLGQPHPLEVPVVSTRARAIDVVPLPTGIRGRWEGWAVLMRLCAECGKPLPPKQRANARYCPGGACRQAAYRQRKTADRATPARRAA